jgi:hypothetical protein
VKLTTHLNLVPRSRTNGAIPPLPHYAFMAWCLVKAQGLYFLPSHFTYRIQTDSGAHQASYPIVTAGLSRSVREADNIPPSRAEVKYAWSYTSNPPYMFMARCLVKSRENCTFTLFYFRELSISYCMTNYRTILSMISSSILHIM